MGFPAAGVGVGPPPEGVAVGGFADGEAGVAATTLNAKMAMSRQDISEHKIFFDISFSSFVIE
jgi:hypothetical protein